MNELRNLLEEIQNTSVEISELEIKRVELYDEVVKDHCPVKVGDEILSNQAHSGKTILVESVIANSRTGLIYCIGPIKLNSGAYSSKVTAKHIIHINKLLDDD